MIRSKHVSGLQRTVIIVAATMLLLVGLAALGFASEGGEAVHHADPAAVKWDFLWRTVDFIVLLAIVIWALSKANLKGMLADRQANVAKVLREAKEAREAAEQKFVEYSNKLEKANQEIDEIYSAIRQEGESEKARLIAEAKATAEKIKESATLTAQQEVAKARAELREEAARLAVQLAGQTLKDNFKKADQDRFVDEYLTKVVKLH